MVDEVLGNAELELLLDVPFTWAGAGGNAATGRATLPSRLRLIVTEYNMMERAGPIKLSWPQRSPGRRRLRCSAC